MDNTWVAADVCTLPTGEQPLRVAEFDELFAGNLVEVDRQASTRLSLVLAGPPDLFDRVRDLADREAACCSFFTFTVSTPPDVRREGRLAWVQLEIAVPTKRADVLTALSNRAESIMGTRGP